MSHKFKIGDVVKCISTNSMDKKCKNKLGKIVNIDNSLSFPYIIEFYEPIREGHNGGRTGKDGHCWHFKYNEIELYIPILKLFLKEKNNES